MEQALQEIIYFVMVIVLLLGGLAMIVGGSDATGKLYAWMFKHILVQPSKRLLKSVSRRGRSLLNSLWRGYRRLPLYWQLIGGLVLANVLLILWVS